MTPKVGDWVTVNYRYDQDMMSRIRDEHGEPPYEVTSLSPDRAFVRICGDQNGYKPRNFDIVVPELDFIEPVCRTTMGVVYKHVKSGEFSVINSDRRIKMTPDQCAVIRQYLRNAKPFNEDLFTI